ncbi:asparagine synthase (glutamine-hydrolyzing) [Catenulispora pinisilvae]|uniref:asparagine synthase (glutamine-hydrolyzing) n=1 Tax=Catenulispora pinisilvae TaxID=2705253 RepID=UPI0018917030|nr:asparagine synthase (glutamine-hydrolyzing) [Catenulispora pinisilvae]
MCGIAGVFGAHDEAMLKRMGDAIAHRGPDGEGVYSDGAKVGYAHRRLAIIDRAHGDQPFVTEDGRYAAVYNGEVYNYRELMAELEALGRTFRTVCDTEVVVQAFAEWGEAAFDRFNGMFAIAIHDTETGKSYLARDHFGIKPLYLASVTGADDGHRLVFGSEIKAVLASGLVQAAPDDATLYRYLRFRIHEDSDRTFFAGIEKVRPGELVVVDGADVQRRMFTTLREDLLADGPRSPFTKDTTKEFKERLTESIRMRLVGEVPVGTALSGGLDSSTVVAVISKLMKQHAKDVESVGSEQNSFSAVFPGSVNDEERYVDAVLAKADGPVNCHKIHPNPDEFLEDLADFVRTQEEPTISTGPYAQYKVMQEATKHVTVLLDGQGADEMMAGYLPYYFVYLRQLRKEKQYGKLMREVVSSTDVLSRYGKQVVRGKIGLDQPVDIRQMLDKGFAKQHKGETFSPVPDDLKARLVEDIFANSLPSLLRYEDRNTMRFSLEGRVPFLDFNLVRYLFTLEPEAIIKGGWNKRILRDSVRGLLPDQIVDRRNKIGFTTPEREWFLRIKNHVHTVFRSDSFGSRPYFDQASVLRAFEEFIAGKNSDTMLFWRMLNVELWLRTFVDAPGTHVDSTTSAVKEYFAANPGKQIAISTASSGQVLRFPIQTDAFAKGDDFHTKISEYGAEFAAKAAESDDHAEALNSPWFLAVSEKVVAISQGRSYFLWEIKPSFAARKLQKFVVRTPAGIGLGSPETMQLAIQEAGLPRIVAASAAGAVGKVVGRKGLFYQLAGPAVRAIDGPTQYSLYPSNVSAKLAPAQPDKAAAELADRIRRVLPATAAENFQGVAIIDANDLGCNILGQATTVGEDKIAEMFKDNPLGQGAQRTPLAVVVLPKQK